MRKKAAKSAAVLCLFGAVVFTGSCRGDRQAAVGTAQVFDRWPGESYTGSIKASTSEDGSRTYVTCSAQHGNYLLAAFIVQHGRALSKPIYLEGQGRLLAAVGGLGVEMPGSSSWLFKNSMFRSEVPKSVVTMDVVGVAEYAVQGPAQGSAKGAAYPKTHEEFVRSRAKCCGGR